MDYHLMIMVYLAEHHVFFPGKLVIQHENWGYQMAIVRHSQMESNGGVQGWVIALQGCVARNRWGKHIYIYSNPQVVPKQWRITFWSFEGYYKLKWDLFFTCFVPFSNGPCARAHFQASCWSQILLGLGWRLKHVEAKNWETHLGLFHLVSLVHFFSAFFSQAVFQRRSLCVAEFFEVLPRTLWVAFAIYVPLGFINATWVMMASLGWSVMAAWGPSNQTCDLLGILSPSSGVSRPYFWLELGWKLNETHEKG